MALIRRLNIVDFKEVVVDYPVPSANDVPDNEAKPIQIPYNIYIDESISGDLFTLPESERNVNLATTIVYGQSKFSNSGTLIDGGQEDIDSDGIPNNIDIDIDGDGGPVDSPEGDFTGVIKRTFLLAKVELWDCTDDGTMTPQQFYDALIQNFLNPAAVRIYEFSNQLQGWLVIGESKPSFYYERCITELNGKVFSGRIPVSKNYFDLADLWIRKNQNGTWNFVSGEGENPLQPVFQFDVMGDYTQSSRLKTTGFDWSFGPKLSSWRIPLQFRTIFDYFSKNNIVSDGTGNNFNLQFQADLKRINDKLRPVNLHGASRFNIIKDVSEYAINTSETSDKAYWSNGFNFPLNGYVDSVYRYSQIPSRIQFDDGKMDRFGVPIFAIQNAFSINNQKFLGKCIPIPDEDPIDYGKSGDNDTSVPSEYRTRVTIADVLSGKVKLDGTNYIRGVVTAHFTFPLKSYNTGDIDNLYFQYAMYPDAYNLGSMYLGQEKVDPFTFNREMRNVVYVQDETAGMELLGTDFYSSSGLEYKGLSESIPLTGYKSVSEIIAGNPGPDILVSGGDVFIEPTSGVGPSNRVSNVINFGPANPFPEAKSISTTISVRANNPATSYWETDTGYAAYERYHFKVGDFIEVYNLNVLQRQYAPRTCKVVNGEYRIIPNEVDNVNDYLEKNGYIKEVDISKLTADDSIERKNRIDDPSDYTKWRKYDYSDKSSIHSFENCLVKITNVAFCTVDFGSESNPLSRKDISRTLLMSNDSGPVYDDKNNEYYGFNFEPCKRVMIRDVSSGDYTISKRGGKKAYVYIPCSTEMGENFLQIPGIPSYVKKTNVSRNYLEWKKKKVLNGNFIDFESTYEWPLTIVGILRRSMPTDFSVSGDDFYEIWPRVYSDLGITAPKKQTTISKTNQPPSGIIGPSITSVNFDPTNIGGTGVNIPGGSRVINIGGGPLRGAGGGGISTQTGGGQSSSTGVRPTCFPKYTNILTPSGQIPIINLSVGDFVITFDSAGNLYERKITHKFIHDDSEKSDIYRYHLSNGTILDITENHPVLTKNGFIHIGNLKIGDGLIDVNNHTVFIVSKNFLINDIVYNVEVDEYNAYIAENIKVHNLTKKHPEIPIVDEGGSII